MRSRNILLTLATLLTGCGSDSDERSSTVPVREEPFDAAVTGSRDPSSRAPIKRADAGARSDIEQGAGEEQASAGRAASTRRPAARTDAPGAAAEPAAMSGGGRARPPRAADEDASVDDDDAGTLTCDAPNLDGLGLETLVTGQGLATLAAATQPPDSNDWYLIEQRGRIMILRDGVLLPTPFLDLQPEVTIGQGYEDRGLVSLAFAPDYATSGLVYVVFTPVLGDDANRDLVLEYRRSDADPDQLDPTSRKKVVEIIGSISSNFLRDIHNGGRATFGPDGYLYVAMGDGGGVSCNDVERDEPQDIGSPFGKILRLDPRGEPPYAAPRNPFARGGDPRVYHYGLRNPYNFSFDRGTGDLYIGDVGQNSFEEVDVAPSGMAGLNFGWAAFEGVTNTCPDRPLRAGSTHTPPIFVADRRTRSCTGDFCDYRAVVGGVVYRGSTLPQLQGVYLFGDYVGRRMVGIRRCGGSSSELRTIRKRCDVGFADELCFNALAGTPEFSGLTGIFEGNDGEIYMVANRDTLLKVVSAPFTAQAADSRAPASSARSRF
jgi:glucose/arabinose dehydrogenase